MACGSVAPNDSHPLQASSLGHEFANHTSQQSESLARILLYESSYAPADTNLQLTSGKGFVMQCRATCVARFAQVETGKLIRSEAAFTSLSRLRVEVGSTGRNC